MKKAFIGFRKHQFPVIFLFILSLLFFSPILLGKVLFFGDNLLHIYPNIVFWKSQILSGSFPLWNPYIFAGVPHFANLATNSLSPFNLIFLLPFHTLTSLSLLTIILVFLSAFFGYLFLLELTENKKISLLGSLIFSFSGSTLAAANDLNSLQGIVLIPLIFWLGLRLINNPSPRNISFLSLGLTLQFFSSHPQYTIYTWVTVAIYLFTFLNLKLAKKIITITICFGLALLLSSIQLIPFIELTKETFRPTTLEFSNQNSLTTLDLPRLIFSQIYGTWESGTSWGPNSPLETGRAGTEGFIGVVPLLIIIYGAFIIRSKQFIFFAVLSLFIFILSFGPSSPVFQLLQNLVPIINKFRSPVRILALYSFTQSVLVALTLQKIHAKKS